MLVQFSSVQLRRSVSAFRLHWKLSGSPANLFRNWLDFTR